MNKYRTADGSKLTPARIARLDEVEARMGDDDDSPPVPEANWATAVRGRFYKPRKQAISLRLDMDVLDWLRRKGPGYQTEINRILREKMAAEAAP
jgi:uncharacterized protein (DUF4415 family)